MHEKAGFPSESSDLDMASGAMHELTNALNAVEI